MCVDNSPFCISLVILFSLMNSQKYVNDMLIIGYHTFIKYLYYLSINYLFIYLSFSLYIYVPNYCLIFLKKKIVTNFNFKLD